MENLIIRKGKPEDSRPSNFLIYSTGSYFFDHIFSYEKEKILELLKKLFEKNKGIFSHQFTTVAELEGRVVGIEHGYTRRDKQIHALLNSFYIIKHHKFDQILKMLMRNYHIERFLKKIHPNSYYVAHLAVILEYHGKGIGGKLLDNAIKKAKSLHFNFCALDVSIHNKKAIKLYEKKGFKIYKEIRNPELEKKYNLHGQYRMINKF